MPATRSGGFSRTVIYGNNTAKRDHGHVKTSVVKAPTNTKFRKAIAGPKPVKKQMDIEDAVKAKTSKKVKN